VQYPPQMEEQASPGSSSRETRLLLATIGVSVVMLFVLARFRFPDRRGPEIAQPAPAPLERLASQGSFDNLASSMADLDRRVRGGLTLVRVEPAGTLTVAARVTVGRAVLRLGEGESLGPIDDRPAPSVIGRDPITGMAVITVDPDSANVVVPRSGPPRPGPRYVAVADASPRGIVLRPHYVADSATMDDAVSGLTLLSMAAAPAGMPPGSAVFTLAGTFVGLVSSSDGGATIVPADALRALAETPPAASNGDLGVEVQALTEALARIGGATGGVMVTRVESGGPADGSLVSGDIVQSVDGRPVTSPLEFTAVAQSQVPGRAIPIVFVRRGTAATVDLTPRAGPGADSAPPASAGRELGITTRTAGGRRTIASVQEGSAGARAGLQVGDAIVSVGGQNANTDLARAFRALKAGGGLLVTIERAGHRRVVALEK